MRPLDPACEAALRERLAGRPAEHSCERCREEEAALRSILEAPSWSSLASEPALARIRRGVEAGLAGRPRPRLRWAWGAAAVASLACAWLVVSPERSVPTAPPEWTVATEVEMLEDLDLLEDWSMEELEMLELWEEDS